LLTCSNYFEYFEPLAKVLQRHSGEKPESGFFKIASIPDFTGVTVLLNPASGPFVFIID
jgi:hypothetical protein